MALNGFLFSLQVGLPKIVDDPDCVRPNSSQWLTSIFRQPTPGPVWLYLDHLDGDRPGNLRAHGGPDKAINVYPGEHYSYWQESLHHPAAQSGGFGENFTTHGLLEAEVCLGDTFRVGGAVVQISQPRQPCNTLARRWGLPQFAHMVEKSGRTGWYFRVMAEGNIQPGDTLELIDRPCPEWNITRMNTIMYRVEDEPDAARALSEETRLSYAWQETLRRKLAKAL